MIQDPDNRYIAAILSACDISGRDVLEIGCGKGRVTRDLARFARLVVASDPDSAALDAARAAISAPNVQFIHAPEGIPPFSDGAYHCVIYTLSLHHVPSGNMLESLTRSSGLVAVDGCIVVVEPGDGGSFMYAKERFGAGSGDERQERLAAIEAMHSLDGWTVGETVNFDTTWHFADSGDFLVNLIPNWRELSLSLRNELERFLELHKDVDGITLNAGRRMNVLRKTAAY